MPSKCIYLYLGGEVLFWITNLYSRNPSLKTQRCTGENESTSTHFKSDSKNQSLLIMSHFLGLGYGHMSIFNFS